MVSVVFMDLQGAEAAVRPPVKAEGPAVVVRVQTITTTPQQQQQIPAAVVEQGLETQDLRQMAAPVLSASGGLNKE